MNLEVQLLNLEIKILNLEIKMLNLEVKMLNFWMILGLDKLEMLEEEEEELVNGV